ncbi:MAG TPA: diadenylate cyclase CdaA [Caldisericia bacterium]|nr:diadenylate cyclase CdaA [Caldisericia bacterium]HPB33838.1 diadenylate cyclase CdaA [Caldisericia bacterium]HQL66966.1 diadenylate cyclase CdaA [Caldisericia bacterium]HQN47929.1 diadenylate cyclase CdaA [Caldisericia bacterium]HQO99098.1 diadenylate cyclase CdaA [Caldisericia bacterium]
MINYILEFFEGWTIWNYLASILDIAIITIILYFILSALQATRVWQLIQGLIIFFISVFIASYFSNILGFVAFNYVLKAILSIGGMLPIIIVIIFQPEIRKFMGSLGRRNLFGGTFNFFSEFEENPIKTIDEIVKAVKYLSLNKIGALIVIKREDNLTDIIQTGIPLNSIVTSELISTIFYTNSPLHDGAIVIDGNTIVAARCLLPLSENERLEKELGTRHRAGVGITEVTDALSIIVSEETGIISLSTQGKLTRYLSVLELRGMLILLLKKEKRGGKVKVD